MPSNDSKSSGKTTVVEASHGITLWKPETDVVLHQALGKLAEECGELSQIVARCLIQGYAESEPVSGKHNYVALREEMADVLAAIVWLCEQKPALQAMNSPRYARKLAGFRHWQKMLEEDAADAEAEE